MKENEEKRVSPLVLVVEDDRTTRRTLHGILSGAGYRTALAANQAETWSGIATHRPDLVLLDVNLPDGNGFEICQRMQKDPGLARIPILFISANEELAAKVRGFEVGGVDYISKPLAGAEVLARVRTHLQLKRAYEALVELQAQRLEKLVRAQQTAMPVSRDLPDAKFIASIRQNLSAGGDFYDVIASGENCTDYLVADASGHDLGASYWTAALKALVAEYASPLNSPGDVLRALNSALGRILPSGTFFTLIYARLNRRNLRLSLANAGHPPAIITHAHDQSVSVLLQDGDVVGAFPDPVFGVSEITLQPGDRFFLYTDGVVEAGGSLAAGLKRLSEACRTGTQQPMAELVPAILNRVVSDHACTDDMVLLGVDA